MHIILRVKLLWHLTTPPQAERLNLLPGIWRDYADKFRSTCSRLQPGPVFCGSLLGLEMRFYFSFEKKQTNNSFIPDISVGDTSVHGPFLCQPGAAGTGTFRCSAQKNPPVVLCFTCSRSTPTERSQNGRWELLVSFRVSFNLGKNGLCHFSHDIV